MATWPPDNIITQSGNFPIEKNAFSNFFQLDIATISADYTILSSNHVVLANGTMNITLPAAASIEGKLYYIKNIGTGIVTIDGNNNETVDGGLTLELENQYESITIISDGNNWHIL